MLPRVELPRIPTKDDAGRENGYLVPIWHVDQGPQVSQVYATVVAPGGVKGPHMHLRREGRFTCVSGEAVIVTRKDGVYESHFVGGRHGFSTLVIPVGVAAAIYNLGTEDAMILNMPHPPWRADEPDEHPVDGWEYRL
jgi:dTDP-4-dehydrorhamnose 3,5-epimerase